MILTVAELKNQANQHNDNDAVKIIITVSELKEILATYSDMDLIDIEIGG